MRTQYRNALNLCGFLLRELARIDDKSLTMEVHITEARVYKDLNDITKAKVGSICRLHSSRPSPPARWQPPPSTWTCP